MSFARRFAFEAMAVVGLGAVLGNLGWLARPPAVMNPPAAPVARPRPPGKPPQFQIVLRADKARYVQREPIRLCVEIRNVGAEDFSVDHAAGQEAALVEVYRNERYDERRMHASPLRVEVDPGEALPSTVFTWSIRKGDFLTESFWDENRYQPGTMTFRAAVAIRRGPHQGVTFLSDDLNVTIVKPEGADALAFRFMTVPGFVAGRDGVRYNTGLVDQGIVPGRSGHVVAPLLDAFLEQHGDSTYAHYVRYNRAMTAVGEPPDAFVKAMTGLLDQAPADFPLRAAGQIEVLQHLVSFPQPGKRAELARKFRAAAKPSADPREQRFRDLLLERDDPRPTPAAAPASAPAP